MGKDKTTLSFLGETFEVHVTPCWGNCCEDCGTLTFCTVFGVVSYAKTVAVYGTTHVETEFAVKGLVDD
jgi:hypothetical protein